VQISEARTTRIQTVRVVDARDYLLIFMSLCWSIVQQLICKLSIAFSYAVVTCEIKLFQNYFSLRRRSSEWNNFAWNYIKIISEAYAVVTCEIKLSSVAAMFLSCTVSEIIMMYFPKFARSRHSKHYLSDVIYHART